MTLISSELHLHIAFRTLVFASKVELANTELASYGLWFYGFIYHINKSHSKCNSIPFLAVPWVTTAARAIK